MSYYSSNVQYQRGNQNYSKSGQYGGIYGGATQANNEQQGSWSNGGDAQGQRVFNQPNYIINNLKNKGQQQQQRPPPTLHQSLGIPPPGQAPVGTFPWQQQFGQQQQQAPSQQPPQQQRSNQTGQVESGPVFGPKVVQQQPNPIQMLKAGVIGTQSNIKIQLRQTQEQEATNELNKQLQVVQLNEPQQQQQQQQQQQRAKSISLLGLAQGQVQPVTNQKDFTWKLQKPGMVFANKTSSEKKNGKAERKNTNMEPKAWLYAWLGFRHKRPENTFQSIGQRPDQYFKCSLVVDGFAKQAHGQATSKKEAQTEAAWDFIAFLKDKNELTATEIDHVNVMKKKLRGEKGSVRESLNSTVTATTENSSSENQAKNDNGDDFDKIKKEVEQSKESENWIEPNPPWLRGNQQVTPVDLFWRSKDLEAKSSENHHSGNGTGGPVVRTTGNNNSATIGGDSLTTTVTAAGTTQAACMTTAGITSTVDSHNVIMLSNNNAANTTSNAPPPTEQTQGSPPIALSPPTPPPPLLNHHHHHHHHHPPVYFDPSVPPPPLPPTPPSMDQAAAAAATTVVAPPPPPPPLSSSDAPPVIYYPPVQQQPQQHTNNQPQIANNIRDMLEDITKELDNENSMDAIPRRNLELEPFDYQILHFCQSISMKKDTFNTLCKVIKIVEKGLKDCSNQLVYNECVKLGDDELIDFCRERLLQRSTKMKILTRHQSTDEIAEHVKSRIAKLRSVCKVIQTGLIAMDVHVEGEMCADLVLFTAAVPTDELVSEIVKILPTQIDKSLDLGVAIGEDSPRLIKVNGTILNERVTINIRLTTTEPLVDCAHSDEMNNNLRRVRRTNFWRSRWADTYSIMDEISALFIWLRRQENGSPLQCLDEWQLQLVIFFACGSLDASRLSPGDAVLRVFEALSSGMVQPNCQIIDPSEPVAVPFLSNLSSQRSADLMNWSGLCLRQCAFGRASDVFRIDVNNNYENEQSHEDNDDDNGEVDDCAHQSD